MKAQTSLEFMIALLAFTAALFTITAASNSANESLAEKTTAISSWISNHETTAHCNFVHLKGGISEYEINSSAKISKEAECFSEEHYFNQNTPKAGAMRPWF